MPDIVISDTINFISVNMVSYSVIVPTSLRTNFRCYVYIVLVLLWDILSTLKTVKFGREMTDSFCRKQKTANTNPLRTSQPITKKQVLIMQVDCQTQKTELSLRPLNLEEASPTFGG